jgi:hypothetical protein
MTLWTIWSSNYLGIGLIMIWCIYTKAHSTQIWRKSSSIIKAMHHWHPVTKPCILHPAHGCIFLNISAVIYWFTILLWVNSRPKALLMPLLPNWLRFYSIKLLFPLVLLATLAATQKKTSTHCPRICRCLSIQRANEYELLFNNSLKSFFRL